jgi:outer membrane protein assembly factor BamB
MRLIAFTLFAFALTTTHAHSEDDWNQFRGALTNGYAPSANLPLEWNEDSNVAWKTPIHGKAWSSPVVWKDQIWMTTATTDGKKLFAVCVNAKSGKIEHDVKVFDIAKPMFCIPYNSYASSTPVVEDGRVWVHFGSAGTACLDTATGETLWTRQDLPCDHVRAAGSSPITFRNMVIINFDGGDYQYVVALNKTTGKTVCLNTKADCRWSARRRSPRSRTTRWTAKNFGPYITEATTPRHDRSTATGTCSSTSKAASDCSP